MLVDLGAGRNRMGGSILAQVTQQIGADAPDVDDPARIVAFVGALRELQRAGRLLAYHDRSDGGLLATLAEMAFAGHCGVSVNLDVLAVDPVAADWGDFKIRPEQVSVRRNELVLKALFTEELGAVLQVRAADQSAVMDDAAVGRPRRGEPDHRQAERSRRDRILVRRQAGVHAAAGRIAAHLERNVLAHRTPARQPGLRRRRLRACERCGRQRTDAGN